MKKTRRSLITSLVTLLLCSAMFVGSTFAWFTDTVSNAGNKIQAGTLDVELYTTEETLNNAGVTTLPSKTVTIGEKIYYDISDSEDEMFNYILWEPGYSTPAGFAIENAGNLALKYELTFFLIDSKTGLENTESEAYDLEHLTKCNANSKLEDAIEVYQDEVKLGTLKDFFDGKQLFTGHLSAGETFAFGDLKLLMPTDKGNEYENACISFDIRLLATQYTEEYDGFGSNQYDALADETPDYANWERYKTSASVTETIKEDEDTVFKTNNNIAEDKQGYTEVTIPKNVKAFVDKKGKDSTIEVETTPILAANNLFKVTTGEGSVGAIDLTVTVDGNKVTEFKDESGEPVPVKVVTYVAKNMTNVSLSYNDTDTWTQVENEEDVDTIGELYYDKVTGRLAYLTNHFSTFVLGADEVAYVKSNNTAYLKLEDAMKNVVANDKITMLKDYYISDQTSGGISSNSVIIDLNNNKITSKGTWLITNGTAAKPGPITATICNGTYVVDKTDSGRIRFERGSTGIFENMIFTTSNNKWYQALQTYATNQTGEDEINKYSFKNCEFKNCFAGFEGKSGSSNEYQIDFENCSFAANNMSNGAAVIKVEAYGYGKMNIKDSSFDINNTNNGGYCVYPDTLRSYTGGKKMTVTLNNVVMNTKGNSYPYTYDYDYNSADGSRDWSAEVKCEGTNVFTHNDKPVKMFIKETSATNKSIAWTEDPDAYKASLAEWVNYASASPACADYNSMNYYLVVSNGCYYIGGQGQQFNDNATVTIEDGKVTKVVVSGYFSMTYTNIGTNDISTQLGDEDNTNVKIYTLAK